MAASPVNHPSPCKGVDTMLVVAAAHISHNSNRAVQINYDKGYRLDAIT